MKSNPLFSIGMSDLIKGLIVTIITASLTMLGTSIESGSLPLDWMAWKPIALSGCGAGIAYLLKNILTNSKDQFMKKEN